MLYKEDWANAKKRFEYWWNGEILDRVVLQVTAKRKTPIPYSKIILEPENVVDKWINPEYVIFKNEKVFSETFFGGESYPNLWINLGPGIMATYIGSEPSFDERTVWFNPIYNNWNEFKGIKYDPNNKWWNITKKLTEEALNNMNNKYLVGITDIGGITDIVASLRDNNNLLFDLIDYPEKVKEISNEVAKLWFFYFNELEKLLSKKMEGMSAWMGIWSPTNWYPIQCDFSAMISPRMFEEFVLPYLTEQCNKLDHTIYHWDGTGQLPHLDLLLSIKRLDGIQWVPGAGKPHSGHSTWFPVLKKIQDAKKLLVLQGVPCEDVENIINNLSPKGLLISTSVDTEEEAKELIKLAQIWTERRLKRI